MRKTYILSLFAIGLFEEDEHETFNVLFYEKDEENEVGRRGEGGTLKFAKDGGVLGTDVKKWSLVN